ncbi:MAG TPA: hypothetical protein VKS21_04440 [Spirochaetota bacterium]|nr:hypothetical protein [Spirochaetota bacterium]
MNYVSVNELGKTIKEKQLFSHLSLGIDRGDKIGLTGANSSVYLCRRENTLG